VHVSGGAGFGSVALVVVGALVIIIGILSGDPLPFIALGLAAIGLAAILEAWVRRGRGTA
jgi:hypothetical protein